jgi:hypothetical protein
MRNALPTASYLRFKVRTSVRALVPSAKPANWASFRLDCGCWERKNTASSRVNWSSCSTCAPPSVLHTDEIHRRRPPSPGVQPPDDTPVAQGWRYRIATLPNKRPTPEKDGLIGVSLRGHQGFCKTQTGEDESQVAMQDAHPTESAQPVVNGPLSGRETPTSARRGRPVVPR